mmetsp:Transcript_18251/g.32762  ORF Transcript_18251/g.32762 Transcript_18251/m.32762 type:complete len:724 (-) Transcript_18251:631-2802(-)
MLSNPSLSPFSPTLPMKSLLARFDFDEANGLVGIGSFGRVYRVKCKFTAKLFALKAFEKAKFMRGNSLEVLYREISLHSSLSHPNTIQLFDSFEDQQHVYMLMELATQGSLYDLIKAGALDEALAKAYFAQVCEGLSYLHEKNIIHRDIKPENILLDKQGRIKLTDFGWSNYYNPESAVPRTTLCGTLEYLPPEMVAETGHNTSADVWCLGVLLFEMLVGYTPFKSPGKDRVLTNISKSKPRFPLSFPPLAKELILRMLEKNSNERISVGEIKEHRWLREHAPIRETLTQSLDLIPLPGLVAANIDSIQKGYLVISKPDEPPKLEPVASPMNSHLSELDWNYSESNASQISESLSNSIRKSVGRLELNLKSTHDESSQVLASMSIVDDELEDLQAKVKELEGRILQKQRDLTQQAATERMLLTQIGDRNMELEKLQRQDETAKISEDINKIKKALFECKFEIKVKRTMQTNLQLELKRNTQALQVKEKEVKDLTATNYKLKQEIFNITDTKRSQLSELGVNADILKSHLTNFERMHRRLGEEELTVARDIQELIDTTLTEYRGLDQRDLTIKVDDTEERIRSAENKLTEIRFNFEEDKAKLTQLFRKKNEAMVAENKEARDRLVKEKLLKIEHEKSRIRSELSTAREAEAVAVVDSAQLNKLRQLNDELRLEEARQEAAVRRNKEKRAELKQAYQAMIKKIGDTEIELGMVKSTVYSIELPSE